MPADAQDTTDIKPLATFAVHTTAAGASLRPAKQRAEPCMMMWCPAGQDQTGPDLFSYARQHCRRTCVLKPKTKMQFGSRTSYILARRSFSSDLGTLGRPGWSTSVTCDQAYAPLAFAQRASRPGFAFQDLKKWQRNGPG